MKKTILPFILICLLGLTYSCSGGSNKTSRFIAEPNFLDSLMTLVSVDLFDQCGYLPTMIQSPYQEIWNSPIKAGINFNSETKELNFQYGYYNSNIDVYAGRLSYVTELGKVKNIKIIKYKKEGIELPRLTAEWEPKDRKGIAEFIITPIIIDPENSEKRGSVGYYVGTDKWQVFGFNTVDEDEFLKITEYMCQLSGIDFEKIKSLFMKNSSVKNEKINSTDDNESDDFYVINDPDGYTNVRNGKSVQSEILFEIMEGEEFKVLNKDGSWWQIDYNGEKGYIHSSRVKPINN